MQTSYVHGPLFFQCSIQLLRPARATGARGRFRFRSLNGRSEKREKSLLQSCSTVGRGRSRAVGLPVGFVGAKTEFISPQWWDYLLYRHGQSVEYLKGYLLHLYIRGQSYEHLKVGFISSNVHKVVGQKKGWQKVIHRRPVYLPQRGLQEEELSVRWGSGAVCSRVR